jgi:hypothetical protein
MQTPFGAPATAAHIFIAAEHRIFLGGSQFSRPARSVQFCDWSLKILKPQVSSGTFLLERAVSSRKEITEKDICSLKVLIFMVIS